MKKLINFMRRGLLLAFDYPIAAIVQAVLLATMIKGLALLTHAWGVEQLVVYRSMNGLDPSYGVEILGALLFVVAFITFWGYFFLHHKIIFAGTYVAIGYWLAVTALYFMTGVFAAGLFYSGLIAFILLYCTIYITLNRNMKISPYRALTQDLPSTRVVATREGTHEADNYRYTHRDELRR